MRAVAIKHAQLRAPTPLPEPEFAANHAWLEGWWEGIAVGAVVGIGVSVLLLPYFLR